MLTLPSKLPHHDARRRALLRRAFAGAGVLAAGPLLWGCDGGSPRPAGSSVSLANIGALNEADENGVRLPTGLRSRIVAVAGKQVVTDAPYIWHNYPDGGATFPAADDGWIYVSNSEVSGGRGGAGALRFAASGELLDAYPILSGTSTNCAGGPTPWGTWLSCEEHPSGNVYECDPSGRNTAVRYGAMGSFTHEAATVDPQRKTLYLTEDLPDGGLYRFTPNAYPNLSRGKLEIAEVKGEDPLEKRAVQWHEIPDPNPRSVAQNPTRKQVSKSTSFAGGEGIWYDRGRVYFTTKWDNRVWAYDCAASSIEIIYDDDFFKQAVLTGVDNITGSGAGDLLVAEDDGDMQLVVITPDRKVLPLLQVNHPDSEIAGPAFSPDGRRLYFSSQRGPATEGGFGVTFEVSGPLFDGA